MAIKLSDLSNKTKKLPIHFNEDTITVEYNPFKINPGFWRWLTSESDVIKDHQAAVEKAKESGESVPELESTLDYDVITRVVTKWDLVEDDGVTPVPITVATLQDFPVLIITGIVSAIFEDIGGDTKKQIKSPSGDTSLPQN